MNHAGPWGVRRSIFITVVMAAALISALSCCSAKSTGTGAEAGGIKLAVYLDKGIWDGTDVSIGRMLTGLKIPYSVMDKAGIVSGKLDGFDLLLMPGGDMWRYASYLGTNGMEKIESFVRNGGGYIGICGGAYFAAERIVWTGWAREPRRETGIAGLNLFAGTARGPMEDFAPTYNEPGCTVNIIGTDHPVAAGLPAIITPLYAHGPELLPAGGASVSVIGTTRRGNRTVLMALTHGAGGVFLTGLHPEDDATRVSWAVIANAVRWCARGASH